MSSSTATDPLFLAVCGNSGVGKTTFVDALIREYPDRFRRAKSVTTRPRRDGEGLVEYDFVSEKEFECMVESGHLLNADHVHGNWYGISAHHVGDVVASGLIPVKEMAAKNVSQLRSRGFRPVIAFIEASATIPVRQGRGTTDRAELGTASSDYITSFRLLRDGRDVVAMAHQIRRWLDAALVLDEAGFATRSHSLAWDESNRAGYDAIAPEFTDDLRVTTAYFHILSEPFWLGVRDDRLTTQGRFLEVAPGRGWLADHLRWPAGCTYRGLELSPMMRELNTRAEQIDIGSAAAMPYDDCTFDGVIGSLVDPFLNANFLAEALRVLRPGGWFAFTTPSSAWAKALRGDGAAYETQFIRSDGSSATVSSACIAPPRIRGALDVLGFEAVQVEDVFAERTDTTLPPAVRKALDSLGQSVGRIAVITTCVAEKAA